MDRRPRSRHPVGKSWLAGVRFNAAKSWRHISPAVVVLLLLTVVFCSGLLFGSDVLLLPDLFSLETPGYMFYRDSLLAGTLPLWTPYSGCGEPYLAGSDIGVFYPPNLIFLLLPTRHAIAVFVTFHIFFSAIATYVLSRLWRVSQFGSLLAGIAFAFGSWSISRVEFLPTLASVGWFPVSLAAFTYWLDRRGWRSVCLLAVSLALGLLAGWPEGSYFTGGSLVLYAVVAGIQQWRVSRRWPDAVAPLGVALSAGFLAILLSAVQILPTWEAVSLSQRSAGIDPGVDAGSVDPFMLVAMCVPSIYGLPVARHTGNYWAPSVVEYYHGTFYIGVLPLIVLLMVVAAFADNRRKPGPPRLKAVGPAAVRTPFLLTLATLSLLYAMGKYTPVFGFLWEHIPLIQKFHAPSKSLMCFVLATSCLAGIGLDYLASGERSTNSAQRSKPGPFVRFFPMIAAVVSLLLVGLCLFKGGEAGRDVYFRLSAVDPARADHIPWEVIGFDVIKFSIIAVVSAFLLRLWATGGTFRGRVELAVVGILVLDLWLTNSSLLITGDAQVVDIERPSDYLPELQPGRGLVRFHRPIRGHGLYGETDAKLYRRARNTLRGWWSTVDRAYNLNQAGPFRPRSVSRVLDLLDDPWVSEEHRQRLLAMLNCERIVPTHAEPLYVTGQLDRLSITHLGQSLPRAYVVGGVRVLRDDDAVLNELGFGEFDPLAVALIDRDSLADDDVQSLRPGLIQHEIEHIEYKPNRMELTVVSERAGLLVVSDTFYPGWIAEVNGDRSPILQVNGGFRGVQIPSGRSTIHMVYRPRSLHIGSAISLVSLLTILVCQIGLNSKRTNRSNRSAETTGSA